MEAEDADLSLGLFQPCELGQVKKQLFSACFTSPHFTALSKEMEPTFNTLPKLLASYLPIFQKISSVKPTSDLSQTKLLVSFHHLEILYKSEFFPPSGESAPRVGEGTVFAMPPCSYWHRKNLHIVASRSTDRRTELTSLTLQDMVLLGTCTKYMYCHGTRHTQVLMLH